MTKVPDKGIFGDNSFPYGFVITLFLQRIDESKAYLTLTEAKRQLAIKCPVVVFDNTPYRDKLTKVSAEIIYHAAGNNQGLSRAYNYAIEAIEPFKCKYLVLLDQDSDVSVEYLKKLNSEIITTDEKYGCICPLVNSHERRVSPYNLNSLGIPEYISKSSKNLFFINSFSAIKISLIKKAGMFNEFYWLDCLDTWLSLIISKSNAPVMILPLTVEHDLSLLNGSVSKDRLINIVYYESCFIMEFQRVTALPLMTLRLVLRAIKNYKALKVKGSIYYFIAMFKGFYMGVQRKRNRHAS